MSTSKNIYKNFMIPPNMHHSSKRYTQKLGLPVGSMLPFDCFSPSSGTAVLYVQIK